MTRSNRLAEKIFNYVKCFFIKTPLQENMFYQIKKSIKLEKYQLLRNEVYESSHNFLIIIYLDKVSVILDSYFKSPTLLIEDGHGQYSPYKEGSSSQLLRFVSKFLLQKFKDYESQEDKEYDDRKRLLVDQFGLSREAIKEWDQIIDKKEKAQFLREYKRKRDIKSKMKELFNDYSSNF